MPKEIYLDNAAATPVDPRVARALARATRYSGNPSSFNDSGRAARAELEHSRKIVADFIGARTDEIIFTASGSEANNLALTSIEKGTVLTTAIEHLSVLESLGSLRRVGLKYIPVDDAGRVDTDVLARLLTKQCRLVSVMYANNEIGTIEPVQKIGKIISEFNRKNGTGILFHIDACQAAGFLDMNVQHLRADLLSFNGSKIYGPRGIGVLYVRRGTPLNPVVRGGSQEHGLRAGTENLPAIIGLAEAVKIIVPARTKSIAAVRDYGIIKIKKALPDLLITGPEGDGRLADSISICVPGCSSESLLLELDTLGIAAGSGSACTSHSVEPSHVLKAIGVPKNYIGGALRFSLGRDTVKSDMDRLSEALAKIVPELRRRYGTLRRS